MEMSSAQWHGQLFSRRAVMMNLQFNPDIGRQMVEIRQSIVAHAQTVMRVLEMADVSLYHDLFWAEQFMLRMVQAHDLNRMAGLLALMPPDMTAEILGTSEKMSGGVMGFVQN